MSRLLPYQFDGMLSSTVDAPSRREIPMG